MYATDADLDANGRVKYVLTPQSIYMHGKVFAIENTTGVVYLVGRLDREAVARYQLIVAAEDEGGWVDMGGGWRRVHE